MESKRVEACEAVRGKPSRTKALRLLLLRGSDADEEEGDAISLALTRSVTRESGTRSPRSTAAAT